MEKTIKGGALFLVLAAVAFTCSNVGVKVAGENISPWQICTGRGLVGMAFALVILHFNWRALLDKHWLWQLLLGVTSGLGFTSFIISIKLLPLSIAMPLTFVFPAVAALLSPLINKEKPTVEDWVAIAVAFGAVVFLSLGAMREEAGSLLGMLMGLMCAFWMGAMTNLARRQSKVSLGVNVFYLFLGNFIVSLPLMIIFDSPVIPAPLDLVRLFVFIIPLTLAGFSLMFIGFRYYSAHRGSVILTIEMPLATLYGLIILKEPLTIFVVVGSIMMLASTVILIRSKSS